MGYPVNYNKDAYKKSDSNDMVNHPKHYKAKNGLETIDVIDAFTENLEGYEATYTGNILKYVCRWKEKNGIEDLKKARWYLDRLIEKLDVEPIPSGSNCFKVERQTFCTRVYFVNRRDAAMFVDNLEDIASKYGFVSMADAFEMIDHTPVAYSNFNYGWKYHTLIANAYIHRSLVKRDNPYPYYVELPTAVDITNL